MISPPISVYLNSTKVPPEQVATMYCALDKTWQVHITMPELDAAVRLLPDVARGVSLDHVMNTWSRQ